MVLARDGRPAAPAGRRLALTGYYVRKCRRQAKEAWRLCSVSLPRAAWHFLCRRWRDLAGNERALLKIPVDGFWRGQIRLKTVCLFNSLNSHHGLKEGQGRVRPRGQVVRQLPRP